MSKNIIIGDKEIGKGCRPFTVAEAGINHNGDLDKAFKMIEVAKESGVDAIKFQTFKAEEFVTNINQTYTYLSQGMEVTESMLEMFKRYEFSRDQWYKIKKKCDEVGITFLSTPQNKSDLDLLDEIGISAIKVGSDDFNNTPLLKNYIKTNLPLILSIGMADLLEVYQTLESIGALKGYPIILLVCTSQYPTLEKDTNLKRISKLMEEFPGIPIGFSDHTQGAIAASVAVGLGACFFEKHFTLDNSLPGPDHWFSENPKTLLAWNQSIQISYEMLGNESIRPTLKEEEMRRIARRYIVAIKDIEKGEGFTEENIGLKRTGEEGLNPYEFETIIGKIATTNIEKGSMLKKGDFE
ncbi:N-acetylneuraminate synthase family protein [Metabacillus fastidiosus]|uniref:N-acetylneuraminate synthase family protein n=1 Tax=Metabacillus fastidiosus TaxID=1458 RepID=UPI003D2D12DD